MSTLCWVESPLQLLSALEAHTALGDTTELEILARIDAPGMRSFLDRFPRGWLPTGVTLTPVGSFAPPPPGTSRVLLGDPFSGQIQKALLSSPRSLRAQYVLLDDGIATLDAVDRLTSDRPRPLVRSRASGSPARTVLGTTAWTLLHTALTAGRFAWVTGMDADPETVAAFTASGGKLRHHDFPFTRGVPVSEPEIGPRIVIGSAMVADRLIAAAPYLEWLRGLAAEGPVEYFVHRREERSLLDEIRTIDGVHVRRAGLPVEIRLAKAPAGAEVFSLPTSAVRTLPVTMQDPRIHVSAVPPEWWTRQAPDALRRNLNRESGAAEDDPTASTRFTVVSVSDSESYLKWACHTLDSLGPDFDIHVLLVDSPILPTREQITNAIAGSSWDGRRIRIVNRADLAAEFERLRPDVVLAAATGPVVQQVYATAAHLERRPGLVSGLPGVGLPATSKGMRYRRLGDMFIAHSEHERSAYEEVAERVGVPVEVVLGRLPMLASVEPPEPAFAPGSVPRTVVFAPQAKVPKERAQRIDILLALARFRRNFSDSEVVVKVRSRPGEQETHHEEFTYVSLIEELLADGALTEGELRIEVGPMADFLQPGTALVTVSSTAALESLDRGLQTMVISDFGVNEEMLNIAFEGAGETLGTLDDLTTGRFGFPSRTWLAANYFQEPNTELVDAFTRLAVRSRERQLSDLRGAARVQDLRRLRAEVRTLSPAPVVKAYKAARKKLGEIRNPHG
ncbi:DUF6716 putative glycosyltransferase [Brevibacterium samyangense]|uniref:Uncharacterized protein n=1 Tax=Brevibacterium samyangense TaxID=366888 RepID=A0ABP5EMS1_9MICO